MLAHAPLVQEPGAFSRGNKTARRCVLPSSRARRLGNPCAPWVVGQERSRTLHRPRRRFWSRARPRKRDPLGKKARPPQRLPPWGGSLRGERGATRVRPSRYATCSTIGLRHSTVGQRSGGQRQGPTTLTTCDENYNALGRGIRIERKGAGPGAE